jgi:hypothetical protein
MSMKKNLSSVLFASAAALLIFSAPAEAGFEWKGATAPAPAAAPADAGMSGMSADPVIMWDGVSEGTMPAEKVGEVHVAPVAAPPAIAEVAPPAIVPAISADLPAPAADEAMVEGFGSDMPLVIALQQIVPAGHQFAFGPGVNPGANVSWQGGKSWTVVLSDMLTSQGLAYRQSGNTVRILRADGMAMMTPPMAVSEPVTDIYAPAPAMPIPPVPLASAEVPVAAAAPEKTVDIRRRKPTSILNRMKEMLHREEAPAAVEAPAQGASAAPEPEKVTEAYRDHSAEMSMPPEDFEQNPMAPISLSAPAAMTAVAPAPYMNQTVAAPAAPVTSGINWEPSAPVAVQPTWHGAQGQTLRDVLKSWSDVAGVELYWSIDYDYRLTQDVSYPGTYDEAVGRALDRFADVRPQPYGQLHQGDGSGAPRVLVVKSYDLIQ